MRRWIVTVAPGNLADKVADDLSARGFLVEQVLDVIGSIVGSADPARVAALRSVPGVAAIEPDEAVEVGPPDSEIS